VEETLIQLLEAPYQLEPLIKRFTSAATQEVITDLNRRKHWDRTYHWQNPQGTAPYRNQISTQLLTVILLIGYFPSQWKVAETILSFKPGKPPNELTTYRPISLLPIVSIVFEELLQKRLLIMVANNKSIRIPAKTLHTIEQTHRVI
jgi:hypothetical protein